jgi:hypothetical protein
MTMTDASCLTLTAFVADMTRAYALLLQVAYPSSPVTVDVALVNPTANFTSRATRSRIWLAQAIALCKRHGVALPKLRRVTATERAEYAGMLAVHVVCAENAARDAADPMAAVHVEVVTPQPSQADADKLARLVHATFQTWSCADIRFQFHAGGQTLAQSARDVRSYTSTPFYAVTVWS